MINSLIEIPSTDLRIMAFDTKPLAGFQYPKNEKTGDVFPNCCIPHKELFDRVNKWFNKFPNCCDTHKSIAKEVWFNKQDFNYIPDKVMNQIVYTEYHIINRINKEDWYKDITDYFEYNVFSFGQPAIGSHHYTGYFIHYLNEAEKIIVPREKRDKLIEYLKKNDSVSNTKPANLNMLISAYVKWLKLFPFDISYFKGLKKEFEKQLPIIRQGTVETNKYLGLSKGILHSEESFIRVLINTTKAILQKINTVEIVRSGTLSDMNGHQLDLINEGHRIKQETLLKDFSKGELKYVRVLRNWLANEKQYFKEIEPLIKAPVLPRLETKAEILESSLRKYGFFELKPVIALVAKSQLKLVELICNNRLPYQIAMIQFLGFIDHLAFHHFREKYKLNKELSKWLNSGDERAVKGQISSLLPGSKENKSRYTAHLHKETVKNDYQALK